MRFFLSRLCVDAGGSERKTNIKLTFLKKMMFHNIEFKNLLEDGMTVWSLYIFTKKE